MTEQTFIKIKAVVGRADDKPITIQEQDEFNDKFIEWLEASGYETCAILELITERQPSESFVGFFELDGKVTPAYERRSDD